MNKYGLSKEPKFHGEFYVHGGLLQIFDRDISYWNTENGPNREDRFQAIWCYNGEFYVYGSMPSIPEEFNTSKTKEEWFRLIELINLADITNGRIEPLPKEDV